MSIKYPDGTYLVSPEGTIKDYAAKWAFGYIVGMGGFTVRRQKVTARKLRKWARRLQSSHVGIWTHGRHIYVDHWKHVHATRDAHALAYVMMQHSIYDLRDQKVIRTQNPRAFL